MSAALSTCIDQEAAARSRVARYWSPTRTPEMTGRTFPAYWASPAFQAAFIAAWRERDDQRDAESVGMVAALPDTPMQRQQALGHWMRTGHELSGHLVYAGGGIHNFVRECCA